MKTDKNSHEPTSFGWRSDCDPEKCLWNYKTFSISFFEIVPKPNGKGTKKVSVGYRLSGQSTMRAAMVMRAEEIVGQLNDGWKPAKKSEKLKSQKF